jgi:hypothetical protein
MGEPEAKTVPAPALAARAGEDAILARLDQLDRAAAERERVVLEQLGVTKQSVEGVKREVADIKRQVRTVIEDQTEASRRMKWIEQQQAPVDEAMKSHHEIELGLHGDVKELRGELGFLREELGTRLDQQDRLTKDLAAAQAKRDSEAREAAKTEAEARAAALAEERRQESIAAKKVIDKRDFYVKFVLPLLLAALTVVGTLASAIITQRAHEENLAATQRAHDDTIAQVRALQRQEPASYAPPAMAAPAAAPAPAPAKR